MGIGEIMPSDFHEKFRQSRKILKQINVELQMEMRRLAIHDEEIDESELVSRAHEKFNKYCEDAGIDDSYRNVIKGMMDHHIEKSLLKGKERAAEIKERLKEKKG